MMNFLFGINALATSGDAAATGGQGLAGLTTPIMMLLMVALFYFILIRPQRKKEKKTKEMIAAIKVGDTVTSIGGIMGKVIKIKDDEVVIETGSIGNPAEKSLIRLAKWGVRDVTVKD